MDREARSDKIRETKAARTIIFSLRILCNDERVSSYV